MDPVVGRELRMEGGHDHRALTTQHRLAIDLGQYLDPGARDLDPRGPEPFEPQHSLEFTRGRPHTGSAAGI